MLEYQQPAYGPHPSLENPRVSLWPLPDMAQGVKWAERCLAF